MNQNFRGTGMLDDHSYDFGRAKKQEPKTVICPTSIDAIKEALRGPEADIAIRGRAHCTGGQSLTAGGTVIDMKRYSKIGEITEREGIGHIVEVQAGASWKDVFNYCLGRGLIPPVYADWLDLTVGGTVSTGGVGQCSFKKGLQADNVIALEVVTGMGEVLYCDGDENQFLFNLVRGGLGQYGVISRAWVKLETAPKMVAVHKLLYTDLHQYLAAQTKLTEFEKIDGIQSHIVVSEKEELRRRMATDLPEDIYNALTERLYIVEVMQYSCESSDDFMRFLDENLDIQPRYTHSYEMDFWQHANRVPPLLEHPLEQGAPKHHHCCFFIGASRASELLAYVFSQTGHEQAMGKGTILVVPLKRSLIKAPYIVLPGEEDQFFVGILRRHLEPCEFNELIRLNESTYQKILEQGGAIYPVGSGGFLEDPVFWRRHYGNMYKEIVEGKMKYDLRLSPNVNLIARKK